MLQNIDLKTDRLFPLDFLKAISIVAVVSFHSLFIAESTYQSSLYLIDLLFTPLRFGVPVFFTISFLLLERSLEKNNDLALYPLVKKRFIRLLIPTLFWCSIAGGLRLLGKANPIDSLIPLFLQGKIFPGSYYLVAGACHFCKKREKIGKIE